MSFDASLYSFEAGGLPPDTFAVLGFEAVEAISRPILIRVVALSRLHGLEYDELVAQPACLKIHLEGVQELRGLVVEFHEEPFGDGLSRYEFQIQGRTGVMSHAGACRVFLEKSAPEILKHLLEEAGFDAKHLKVKLRKSHPKLAMHVQYNETNLDFFARTAERAGIFHTEILEDGEICLQLADDNTAFPLSEIPKDLEVRSGAGLVETDLNAIFQIRRSNRMHGGSVKVSAYDFETPGTIARASAEGPGQGTSSRFETSLRTAPETTDLARTVRESVLGLRERITATTHTPLLRSGTRFRVSTQHGAGFGGDYLAVEIRHEGSQEGSLLGNGIDSHYRNHVVAQPASLAYRHAVATPTPKVAGVLVAKVDGPDGEYAPIDDQGRYRARFPFDEGEAPQGAATPPIRMTQPNSGPGWGFHSPLHKGTDLVLAFEDGNIDRPVAIGALPNPSHASPVTSANRSESRWKTATGNAIVLDDLKGKTKVFVVTSEGRILSLDDTPDTAGIVMSTPAKKWMKLDDKNKLVELSLADGDHFLRLTEQGDGKGVALLATGTGHLIQLDDEAKNLVVQTAKGHMIRLDDGEQMLTISDADSKHVIQIDIGGSKMSFKTEGDMQIEAKGALKIVAASVSMQSKSGAIDLKSAAALNAQGANVNLKADQKVALQSGTDASVKAGTNLKLEGGVNVESKAGVANKMTGTMTNVESSAINTIKGAMVMIN